MDDSSSSKCCDSEDYNMKKLNSGDPDRLSELPDSLILKILSPLEMREVVRTSLLSKRWKDLWTTIPCLNFDESWDWVSTRNFISRALFLYKGVQIRKLKIYFWEGLEKSLFCDLDLWLRFAIERKVEVLCVHLASDLVYVLPQCLYSCSSITKLLLCGCKLQIHGKVKWDQLKKLKFEGDWLNQNAIKQIVSGSPQLEVLDLNLSDSYGNLTIQSNSLKKLSIKKTSNSSNYRRVLTICASKLETLAVYGDAYSKYSLIGISALTDVTLYFVEKRVSVVETTLRQILPTIRHVEAVTLSTSCLKVLRVMKGKYPFYPLSNVKLLTISCPINMYELICFLEIFPKLEMLVIEWDLHDNYVVQSGNILYLKHDIEEAFEFDEETLLKSEAIILKSFMLHLRTVKIDWYYYEASLFQFVNFLLDHAVMVETIVIRKKGVLVKPNDMFMAEQNLQSLQRSFPDVQLIFCRDF